MLVPGQVLHLVLPGVELSLVGEGGEVGLVRELVVVKVDSSWPDSTAEIIILPHVFEINFKYRGRVKYSSMIFSNKTTTYIFKVLNYGCNHAKKELTEVLAVVSTSILLYCTSRIRIRCCDITFCNTCTLRRCLQDLIFMFHNCSITKELRNFWSKQTRCNWTKVTKQFLVCWAPFWTESRKELCHLKAELFSFVSVAPFYSAGVTGSTIM